MRSQKLNNNVEKDLKVGDEGLEGDNDKALQEEEVTH